MSKAKNRKATITRANAPMTTYGEILEYCHTIRAPDTLAELNLIEDDRCFFLGEFLGSSKNAEGILVETFGFIFSTKRCLLNCFALHEIFGTIYGSVDGTFRFHKLLWVIGNFGFNLKSYDEKTKKYVATFKLFSMAFMKSETILG